VQFTQKEIKLCNNSKKTAKVGPPGKRLINAVRRCFWTGRAASSQCAILLFHLIWTSDATSAQSAKHSRLGGGLCNFVGRFASFLILGWQ
jgi:hypothetical protein